MKRITALALAACLLLGLALTGCGGGTSTPPTNPPATDTPATTAPDPTNAPSEPTDPPATPGPTEEPTPTPNIADLEIPPLLDNGLELPVQGATGFASVALPIWPACPEGKDGYKMENYPNPVEEVLVVEDFWATTESSVSFPGAMAVLVPGTDFEILEERGDWWRIRFVDQASVYGEAFTEGWIEHRYCFINLPDVIPSILYNDTNCSGSIFVSCGKDIPNVTDHSFYYTLSYNVRLMRNEFIMPMLYSAARDVCAVQHKALAEGNCLEIYQTFRPKQTQKAVAEALTKMAEKDEAVSAGTSTDPWSMEWFMGSDAAEHQLGCALDVNLVRMTAAEIKQTGSYSYYRCTAYEPYEMPSPMHELSAASVSQVSPTDPTLAPTMTDGAILLRSYFVDAGFTPRASEWWHFDHPASKDSTADHPSDGNYYTETLYSTFPQ